MPLLRTGGVETPVKPTSSQLDNGEIAVNYHKGTERLFIKNDNEEVVEFVSKDEVDKKQDKVDGVNIVRKEFKEDYGTYTEGVIEIGNGVYNAMLRKDEILFTSGSDKGEIFFEPIGHTIDGKYFPAGVKCKHKKTDDPLNNDLRIARMCDLPSVTPQVQSDWNETDTTSKAYILNKPTIPSNTSELNNDSGFLTEHQDITGKADKVSNPTNGNFAALDSNGNLIDSGHKHSDYQASLVSGTNIKTINGVSILTSGDLTVLASTTDSVTSGSTTPITSGGVYTALQSYLTTSSANSTYEKKMSFTTVSSTLPSTCVVNTYYRITSSKTSLAIKLPSSSLTAGDTIGISFTAGSSITTPTVSTVSGYPTIYKQDGWSTLFEANATYDIVALYDGGKWLVTSTKFNS